MTATTAIYALVCPVEGKVRYVGQSKHPLMRYGQHVADSRAARGGEPSDSDPLGTQRRRWIRGLLEQGLEPELAILEEVEGTATEDYGPGSARQRILGIEEQRTRRFFEAGHPLINKRPRDPRNQDQALTEARERGRKLAGALGLEARDLLED